MLSDLILILLTVIPRLNTLLLLILYAIDNGVYGVGFVSSLGNMSVC